MTTNRPARRGPGATRKGVTFIEVLLVMLMVAALTGVASMYYRGLISEGNVERCRIDMRTLKKAIAKLETDQKTVIRPPGTYPAGGRHIFMEREDLGVNGETSGFTLDRLLDFRLVTGIPDDPFTNEYQIDFHNGELLSWGPDLLPGGGDDIRVRYRPPFEVLRASYTEDREAVLVEFSRRIDPYSVYASAPEFLPIQWDDDGGGPISGAATPIETAARVMSNPYAVIVRFKDDGHNGNTQKDAPGNGPGVVDRLHLVEVFDPGPPAGQRSVRAMDATTFNDPFTGTYPAVFIDIEDF